MHREFWLEKVKGRYHFGDIGRGENNKMDLKRT
jgi:hypothetical protein